MRACVHATRLGMIQAKIARRSFYLHARHLASRMRRIIQFDRKRMHVDISVWTIAGAKSATNAPILNNDFERITPPDRTHRTTDHAKRVAALPARGCYQITIEAQPFADQTAHAIMGVSTGPHALIATRAAV